MHIPQLSSSPLKTWNASEQFERKVYGLLGMPVDVVDVPTAVRLIEKAAAVGAPFLVSTTNLNFLVASRSDQEFRESLLVSDLCTADGMPIVWLGRLFGIPIKHRVAGSDIIATLRTDRADSGPLKVFLFGANEGVAAIACRKLNSEVVGMTCVGSLYPGVGSVDEMSVDHTIEAVNASKADLLAVALGAKKGQSWLLRNHDRLRIAVRIHVGASINFLAGTLERAPKFMQKLGLEWLWRIKEEPHLWRRYWNDGVTLLQLVVGQVIPLLAINHWDRFKARAEPTALLVVQVENHDSVTISLNGDAIEENVGEALPYFENAVAASKDVVINFSETRRIDARFLGLILMLNKVLKKHGQHTLGFVGVSSRMGRLLRLNGFAFLLCQVK